MEYLVTMTTHVPDGTTPEAVDEMRQREAARARELAAAHTLLRLWRPPLQAGEWRTLGLFAAPDGTSLEEALSSMPLRVWRTDEVTALSPHPNDPGPSAPAGDGDRMELFTAFTLRIPDGTADDDVQGTQAREAQRAAELARDGILRRLWLLDSPPGRALGLWRARDADELQGILDSLPLRPWLETEVTPLSVHPSDPGIGERAP